MVFPINQLKIDPLYVSLIEDQFENNILAKYTAFKNGSAALVMAFNKEKNKYGSINNIPRDTLKKYNSPFSSLLEISKNLRVDLQRQVNKNTKDLEYIQLQGDENSFINEIALRKRKKLYQKIEYFDDIVILLVVFGFCMEQN